MKRYFCWGSIYEVNAEEECSILQQQHPEEYKSLTSFATPDGLVYFSKSCSSALFCDSKQYQAQWKNPTIVTSSSMASNKLLWNRFVCLRCNSVLRGVNSLIRVPKVSPKWFVPHLARSCPIVHDDGNNAKVASITSTSPFLFMWYWATKSPGATMRCRFIHIMVRSICKSNTGHRASFCQTSSQQYTFYFAIYSNEEQSTRRGLWQHDWEEQGGAMKGCHPAVGMNLFFIRCLLEFCGRHGDGRNMDTYWCHFEYEFSNGVGL